MRMFGGKAILLLMFGTCFLPKASFAEPFVAGGYSFSDELGGFRITSVRGSGTATDPIILEEEFIDTAPVILVIRRLKIENGMAVERRSLSLKKVITNSTRRIWAGFELELQEILYEPSSYEDGLSFNQMDTSPPDIGSDRFARNNRIFEPHDRVRFDSGHVDPGTVARFSMVITDPTPIPIFYLVQDPQLLYAGKPPYSEHAFVLESGKAGTHLNPMR